MRGVSRRPRERDHSPLLQALVILGRLTSLAHTHPMTLQIRLENSSDVPLEVEGVTPCAVAEKSLDEIRRVTIFEGNRRVELGDFFSVEGDPSDLRLEWEGELAGVHWIGAKLSRGQVHIRGSAGRHVGSEMTGGEIHIHGNAGDWVGAEMSNGLIHVHGDAGHLVGAAYRGSTRGMRGGSLLVDGRVGNELGHTLRRGLIAVGGDAGDLVGFNMLAGTILVFGESGIRHGAGMRRGTLGFFSNPPELLPTFRKGCTFQPPTMPLILRHLNQLGFDAAERHIDAQYDLYHGDLIEGGRGEILIRA